MATYYLNDLHEEVPEEEATIKIVEVFKDGKFVGRAWIDLRKRVKKVEKLPEYDELAKEGEPLPSKYYKWQPKEKTKFVLQRHWPTGKLEPIKPGEKPEEMHKTDLVIDFPLSDLFAEAGTPIQKFLSSKHFIILKIRDHIDLRLEKNGKLIGVTMHPPVPKGITAWQAFQERMKPGQRTQATPKREHPKSWLTREGELRFPTRHPEQPEEPQEARAIEVARMDILDKGEVKYGVQRKNLHEYFFYGEKLKGRFVLRKLKIGKKVKHWAWLFVKPEDQRPLDPVEHKDEGYWKIDWIRLPSPEVREDIEQEVARARREREAKQHPGAWQPAYTRGPKDEEEEDDDKEKRNIPSSSV